MATARTMVTTWNEKHPEGTRVVVRRDNGDVLETTTRSPAWVVGGTAVVSVVGISGGYALERVTPRD